LAIGKEKERDKTYLLLSHLVAFDRIYFVLGNDHETGLNGILWVGFFHPSDPLRRFPQERVDEYCRRKGIERIKINYYMNRASFPSSHSHFLPHLFTNIPT
jgi:hypothetical protein